MDKLILYHRTWDQNVTLYFWFSFLGILGCLIWLMIDTRLIVNESPSLKPLKFFLATFIFTVSWPWVQNYFPANEQNVFKWVNRVIFGGFTLEMILIIAQGLRGVRSHFNSATWYDGLIFTTMGFTIFAVWLACVVVWSLAMKANWLSPGLYGAALCWGLGLFLLGSVSGYLMGKPKPDQILQLQSAQNPGELGGHLVGGKDGEGRKMPVTGWSLDVGDLRIAHFIGMHGLQIMIAVYFILSLAPSALATWLIHSTGLTHLVFFLFALARALSGKFLY